MGTCWSTRGSSTGVSCRPRQNPGGARWTYVEAEMPCSREQGRSYQQGVWWGLVGTCDESATLRIFVTVPL